LTRENQDGFLIIFFLPLLSIIGVVSAEAQSSPSLRSHHFPSLTSEEHKTRLLGPFWHPLLLITYPSKLRLRATPFMIMLLLYSFPDLQEEWKPYHMSRFHLCRTAASRSYYCPRFLVLLSPTNSAVPLRREFPFPLSPPP